MTDETYNSWTNRETWAVALHINNDQGWQESVHEALREAQGMGATPGVISPSFAGEIVRENVEETLDELLDAGDKAYRSIREDIGSLWRVDWHEIGASFLADITEQDA